MSDLMSGNPPACPNAHALRPAPATGSAPPQPSHALAPRFLVLPATYRCNLKCKSCACPPQARVMGELSTAQLGTCLASLTCRSPDTLQRVNLTGGEPFLRDDIVDIVALLSRYGVKEVGISSNGLLVDRTAETFETLLNAFPRIKWHIQLSVDGPQSVHDMVRGSRRSFAAVLTSLRRLLDLRSRYEFGLSTNTTISRENISTVSEHDEWMEHEFGGAFGRQLTFAVSSDLFIDSRDSAIRDQFDDCSYLKTLRDVALWVYREQRDFFALDVYLMLLGYSRFTPCVFRAGGYFLEPSGAVYKCSISRASFVYSALQRRALCYTEAQGSLRRIEAECQACFNNCGNYLVSRGLYDFLGSSFVRSRRRVLLSGPPGDADTQAALKGIGVDVTEYRGQALNSDDLVLCVKATRREVLRAAHYADHRFHLIPMGLDKRLVAGKRGAELAAGSLFTTVPGE